MSVVFGFLGGWKDLIVAVFKEYPLAAAIMTAVAIGAFLFLEHERNSEAEPATVKHAGLVLLGWLIVVPIVGFTLKVLGVGIGLGSSTVQFVYGLYKQQPVFCLSMLAIAVIAYFVWPLI